MIPSPSRLQMLPGFLLLIALGIFCFSIIYRTTSTITKVIIKPYNAPAQTFVSTAATEQNAVLGPSGRVDYSEYVSNEINRMDALRRIDKADSIIQSITMRRGTAKRQPGEADTTFLKRVLPFSYPSRVVPVHHHSTAESIVAYAWRPSAFGKQLFFSVRGTGDNEYGTDLFILDPFQADTYAVQVLKLEFMGDLTNLASLFFADVDQDGQKELLALLVWDLSETVRLSDGKLHRGRFDHYDTVVFRYVNLGSTGRPQYRLDPKPRGYLDELPTAAAVRQALARHQRTLTQSQPATTSWKRK